MKFTKILLVIPAFMMIGCKGNAAKVDPNKVDEATFNGVFQGLSVFRNENVKMVVGVSEEGDYQMIAEAADGKAMLTSSDASPYERMYVEFGEETDYLYRYDKSDPVWNKYDFKDYKYSVNDIFFAETAFPTLSYKDFTYNEENKKYEATNIHATLKGEGMVLKTVEAVFEDNKITSFGFTFINDQDSKGGEISGTFTYGGQSVELPDVE